MISEKGGGGDVWEGVMEWGVWRKSYVELDRVCCGLKMTLDVHSNGKPLLNEL